MANQKLYEQYNPWWQGGQIPADFRFKTKRRLFEQLIADITNKKIISVVGLRRIGKSVLLYQIIEHLLEQGVDPRRIFYLKADDPVIEIEKNIISDAIDFYENVISHQRLDKTKEKVYFFFDEVQKVGKWGEYLKRYFDLGYQIKFFVTGSSSIQIIKTSKESLAGRSKEYVLPPLSFSELFLWNKKSELSKIESDKIFDFQEWAVKIDKSSQELSLQTGDIESLLKEYFSRGGFPILYFEPENPYDYIKNEVVERVIKRDIPEVTGIRNSVLLQQILILIAKESGNIFSLREMSRKLGINFETVASYLFYLEESFLLTILRKYGRGGYSQAKTMPKIHISDIGILSAASGFREQSWLDPALLGHTVEGLVVNTLNFSFPELNVFFWRDKVGEVDVILERGKQTLPIEVKYQNQALKSQLTYLDNFQVKYKSSFSLVVTKQELKVEPNRIFVPLWLFLLLI